MILFILLISYSFSNFYRSIEKTLPTLPPCQTIDFITSLLVGSENGTLPDPAELHRPTVQLLPGSNTRFAFCIAFWNGGTGPARTDDSEFGGQDVSNYTTFPQNQTRTRYHRKVVGAVGLEPTTSPLRMEHAATAPHPAEGGRTSEAGRGRSLCVLMFTTLAWDLRPVKWLQGLGSNQQPPAFQTGALPAELQRL